MRAAPSRRVAPGTTGLHPLPLIKLEFGCARAPRGLRRGVACGGGGGGASGVGDLDSDETRRLALKAEASRQLLEKYGGAASQVGSQQPTSGSGVFWLCLVNCILYVLDHVLRMRWVQSLYLYHRSHRWWQFITSAFCHSDWQHLSSNIFMLYVFGKLVEEEEGALGVWTTYIVCALGGSLVSFFVIPDAVSLGASAAVFGLFIVSVLLKLSWNIRKLLEAAILGQFVYQQVVREIQNHVAGGVATAGGQVNHLAHLCGALAGAILVLLLRQLPEPEGQK